MFDSEGGHEVTRNKTDLSTVSILEIHICDISVVTIGNSACIVTMNITNTHITVYIYILFFYMNTL